MPRYYCDYCDTYLTHDSPSVRKQHNAGYKHKGNVRQYYQQFEEQQTQSLIEQKIKEHMGQASALQQVGAAYAAMQRGRPPFLPFPMMQIPGLPPGSQLPPGYRPPVLPRPMAPPVYGAPPQMAPPPMAPPVSGQQTFASMPTNGPPAINIPGSVPGQTSTPSPNSAPSPAMQSMYHGAPGGPNFGTAPNMSALPSFPSATGNNAAPNNNQ